MRAFTKTEIEWVISLLDSAQDELLQSVEEGGADGALAILKMEQYAEIACKFRQSLEQKSKLIGIIY